MCGLTSAKTVAPTKLPFSNPGTVMFDPSRGTSAPSFFADSIREMTLCLACFEINGPISVSGFHPIIFQKSLDNSSFYTSIDMESFSLFHDVFEPGSSFSNQNNRGQSHASLSCRPKTGCNNLKWRRSVLILSSFAIFYLIDSLLLIGIGHNYSMVLRAHIGLHSLSMFSSPFIDVFSRSVRSDKGNRFDVRIVTEEVDCVVLTMDNVERSIGNS